MTNLTSLAQLIIYMLQKLGITYYHGTQLPGDFVLTLPLYEYIYHYINNLVELSFLGGNIWQVLEVTYSAF